MTRINPEYWRTSPDYALGQLAGAGVLSVLPGAGRGAGKLVPADAKAGVAEAGVLARDHLPPGTPVPRPLDRTESTIVDSAGAAIPPLTPSTTLQKALDPKGGQLQSILNNSTPDSKRFPLNGVGGSVAALADVLELTTPQALMDGLALWYTGSGHIPELAHVLRFTTPNIGRTPNAPQLDDLLTPGGIHPGEGILPDGTSYPFTGHGFTASPNHIIPEYVLEEGAMMDFGATLVQIAQDGSARVIRILDGNKGCIRP